jgi:hypothetical protein
MEGKERGKKGKKENEGLCWLTGQLRLVPLKKDKEEIDVHNFLYGEAPLLRAE